MTILPWLAKAGRFDVEPIGAIPHFNQAIDPAAPPTGVLHTMEGGWDGSLSVFKQHYAPHFMVGPGRIAQLVQVGTIGAALVTHNWIPMVQVEVVGFSQENLWLFDDATAEAVAALMAACKAEYGIPLTRPWADGVYGMARANDPHRNHGEFGHVAGWYGHGDCPSPDSHWDPGALRWSELFRIASAMPHASADPSAVPIAPPRPCAFQCGTPVAEVTDCGRPSAIPITTLPDLSTVKGLQRALVTLNFQIGIDGDYGTETEGAVKSFQHHAGLPADGKAGPLTKAALMQALSDPAARDAGLRRAAKAIERRLP